MFPQGTLLDPIFWMVLGAIQVLFFAGANEWAKEYELNMNWWKWVGVAGWWFTFLLTIAGAFTLHGENEGMAGWYFLGWVGTAWIICGAILARIIWVLRLKSE